MSEPQLDTIVPLEGVAIIGMAGRFPGARNVEEFWENLLAGKDTISRFALDEVEARNASVGSDDYVAARGILDDIGMFDAEFFGIPPREAERMDPQHRIFLETCAAALDDAGYVSQDYAGEIGLFAGCALNTYLLANLAGDRTFLDELTGNYQVGEFASALGNDKDFLTTRVAYKLNLRGPVVSVQSACATSLVAVCQAAQSLLNYSCDMALAGGVSATFPQRRGHVYQDGGIVSKDGHCRPFDAEATGTVFGHGAGVVLLKRLEDAVRDGDHIAAVIRGFAVNNDGSAKAGYMAPGIDGQARVIAAAQAMAGISPAAISYIEAHGTGTPLGDPIEIAALTKAFSVDPIAAGACVVGTAKGNVGHLDAAAGITGLIKTTLSLEHRVIPGLAHFKAANPNIDLTGSPFRFEPSNRDWRSEGPRRAGVSAFGVGGVNAHVVLEEAPVSVSAPSPRAQEVLCVSARSAAAAEQAAADLAAALDKQPQTNLADAAYTLAIGRRAYPFRVAVTAATAFEAATKLRCAKASQASTVPRLSFIFSGQGTQFPGMGEDLYRTEAVYRNVIDDCAEDLGDLLPFDLRDLLFRSDAERLGRTEFAQPAIFVTELALATLWQSWGIRADAMLGHSLGEYVAATLAGVFSVRDAVRLVARRGQLIQAMVPGAMLSVALGETELTPYLSKDLQAAAFNAPRASVVAGSFDVIALLEQRFEAAGIASRRLHTSHAFHSAMMQPMVAAFQAEVAKLTLHAPAGAFVSSVTGTWMTSEQATSASYWAQQCVLPVRFHAALRTLLAEPTALLEVGPGDTLTALALQSGSTNLAAALPSVTRARETRPGRTPADALASLWEAGIRTDWQAFYASERRKRISLPTYPFERKLHWIEPPPYTRQAVAALHTQAPEPLAMPPATPAAMSHASRGERIEQRIAEVLTELSGIATTPDEAACEFLELGFDSLFLTQATQALSKAFGVKLTFRQLMEQFSSIAALAEHLDGTLPPEAFAAPALTSPASAEAPGATTMAAAGTHVAAAGAQPLDRLFADQLATLSQMFSEQVATLKAAAGMASPPVLQVSVSAPAAEAALPGEVRMVRPGKQAAQELTPQQQQYIADLVAKYEARTPTSKSLTQQGRSQLADPRAVAGFRPQWKEMVYPLVTERARGSRLWDVDGNEYIDIVNGYGCILFGHSPDFVVEAVREQLDRGVAIGPQTPLASEVAALLCELTGNERVTFCNTGSEAVMAAIRVARTVTGRDKFVYFTGDYHGTFDEVLVRQTPRGSAPVAPGIPLANTTNVVVLEYGAQASLDYLRINAEDIAAVLIEPVQTRHPDNQPFDFIRSVRALTEQTGTVFILDEVVTGFRLAPGGMQQFLGLRADMCTYGKVIGGGHPIGVLSGKATYLDALDGGAWQYGDSSGPEVGVTFFAGTFVRHPLALAAARAVLLHLRDAGPALQQELNAKTAALAVSLDRFFVERGVPSRIHHFASWFYFTFPNDARLGSLLYYAMRARGIHIQEGYPCFLTTAHTVADLAAIETAFRDTVVEMQQAGVLPPYAPPAKPGMHAAALPEMPAQVVLTEPQREIFLAAALNDDANCAFNESLTLHLRGEVREDDFLAALQLVIERHDALRSTVSADGEALVVHPAANIETEMHDLTGMDAMSAEAALVAAIEQEATMPFDLEHGPLLRASWFRISSQHGVLLLTAHHIVLDGWSANVLLEEVGRVYSRGMDHAQLGALVPFSSYAMHEAARQSRGEFLENESFWVEKFAGRSPRLELPLDRPRTAAKSYRGSTARGRIELPLYNQLKQSSAKAGCTLYVTLLSGFEILLHRLCGQSEVVVGISTAGQALFDDANLVGHAVHFLPMLSELRSDETAQQHLRATRTALLDAYDHQEFTFGSLLRKLHLERGPGRLPLIEVQFNLEKVGSNVAFDGLGVEIVSNAKRFVNTDLFLNVVETATGLEFTCDYNIDLLDESTVDRWLGHWKELLGNAASAPETRVDQLALLPAAEREELLAAWNQTAVDFGPFDSVAATFLRRAEREPARVALECGDAVWTNAQLVAYAKTLAVRLISAGLTPGSLCGIAVERSPEMLGAVLAVMMAGAAYLPLDPRHPKERLEAVLEDAGAGLLLTSRDLALETRAKVLRLDQAAPHVESPATATLPARPGAEDLAYVIYTSGSTGKPKGVAIPHGALVNLLRCVQRAPGLDEKDTLVAITTLAFDIAGLELLLPLVTGARLVIATDAEVLDGVRLLALLERTRATVMQATPGAWRLLLDAGWEAARSADRPKLKALCGGEALPRELADRMLERAGEVWNMYGPTETTIWSSATRVSRDGTGALRLGTPIANTEFHVLDAQHQVVPIGVVGELFIGGLGLAQGYWRRPELTAEKFIANPFAATEDLSRLYATGDLARRHEDGTLELLGRTDFQVKIRGFRIELPEIEATLTQHPQVKEAVVIQQKSENGPTRLAAFVTTGFPAEDPRAPSLIAELPVRLATTLPDYMVPQSFVILSGLPRTPNGKVDRKALPSLQFHEPLHTFTAPATPTQQTLAAIWAEVLEVTSVSTHDSIFELGADSLVIFRIAARAQRAGLAINATQIFQHRTIAGLSEALEQGRTAMPVRLNTRIAAASRDKYKVKVEA